MRHQYKIGQLLSIIFNDHSKHGGDLQESDMLFELVGRFVRQDRKHIVLSVWHYADNFMNQDDNCESFSIVKNAIVKVTRL